MELNQKLNQRLEPDLYAKLIEAEAQMGRGDYRDAIGVFQDAKRSPIHGWATLASAGRI